MSTSPAGTPAGWHPQEDGRERFWNGTEWTQEYRTPAAVAVVDKPAKKKAYRPWMGYAGALVVGLVLGSMMGSAAGDTPTSAAGPAPTVTVRATTTVEPEVVETEAPPVEAAVPSTKDFEINIKILRKKCFGSAGCNVTYRIVPQYVGTAALPEGTVEVTYTVKGAEDPITNTFTIEDDQASFDSEEMANTTSSGKKLTAAATDVSVQ